MGYGKIVGLLGAKIGCEIGCEIGCGKIVGFWRRKGNVYVAMFSGCVFPMSEPPGAQHHQPLGLTGRQRATFSRPAGEPFKAQTNSNWTARSSYLPSAMDAQKLVQIHL